MREEEINKKIADVDKDLKGYVDMKIRAVKKLLAPFIWMRNNPGKAIMLLVALFLLSAFVFHMVDIKGTIEKKFDIEFKDETHK